MAEAAVYVRSTGTGIATRPRPGQAPIYIGAVRDQDDPRIITYTREITAIPRAEWDMFRREYERMLAERSLALVPAVLWLAQEKKREQLESEQRAKASKAVLEAAAVETKVEAGRKAAADQEIAEAEAFLQETAKKEHEARMAALDELARRPVHPDTPTAEELDALEGET